MLPQVEPALPRPNVGDIRDPRLIGPRHSELPLQEGAVPEPHATATRGPRVPHSAAAGRALSGFLSRGVAPDPSRRLRGDPWEPHSAAAGRALSRARGGPVFGARRPAGKARRGSSQAGCDRGSNTASRDALPENRGWPVLSSAVFDRVSVSCRPEPISSSRNRTRAPRPSRRSGACVGGSSGACACSASRRT